MKRFRWWGSMPHRVLTLSMPSAVALSAPLWMLLAWYCWSSFSEFDRYRRAFDPQRRLDAELFHLFVHDQLDRDMRRLVIDEPPVDGPLPVFEFSLAPEELAKLNRRGDDEGEATYVNAYMKKGAKIYKVGLRYRGKKHWHRLGAQKSLKVRLKRGELVDGARVFNLINDVTPFGLEEAIIMDYAKRLGLLTPSYYAARVRINNSDMGVYRYVDQPTEGLLRRARRMPGSIFSGNRDDDDEEDAPPVGGFGESLFSDSHGWQKVAARSRESDDDFTELQRFLTMMREADHRTFQAYAAREMDLDAFSRFDALDVLFGGDQHDNLSNHKLYFDGYTGRVEPIAWNFRGFKQEAAFNLIDTPLLLRLKFIPEYLVQRDRQVYELLTESASPPAVRALADAHFAEMHADLRSDPYWDAYKLLPRASRFHRFMVRPMNTSRWLLAADAELRGFAERSRYLRDALERRAIALDTSRVDGAGYLVRLGVDGHEAYVVEKIAFDTASQCRGTVRVVADRNHNRVYDAREDVVVAQGEVGRPLRLMRYNNLYPGVSIAPRDNPSEKAGRVRAEREARRYGYIIHFSGCVPESGSITLRSRITDAGMRLRFALKGLTKQLPDAIPLPEVGRTPRFAAGERSPHPWSYEEAPTPSIIRLGPGVVSPASMTYEAHQTVIIAPGTELRMADDASLVFYGPLHAEGHGAAPIVIAPGEENGGFGGIVIRGHGAAGSRLSHVRIEGARPKGAMSAALTIQDTTDITIDGLQIAGAPEGAGELLHATYVDGLRIDGADFTDAPGDAVDLEFVRADIQGLRVADAGDECLDLMGATVRIADSALMRCANNGVSAGEETRLTMRGVFIGASAVAVLAKNASFVEASRSLFYGNTTTLRTNRRDVHYDEGSRIAVEEVAIVETVQEVHEAADTQIVMEEIRRVFPVNGELQHLRDQVLGLDAWGDLIKTLTPRVGAETHD